MVCAAECCRVSMKVAGNRGGLCNSAAAVVGGLQAEGNGDAGSDEFWGSRKQQRMRGCPVRRWPKKPGQPCDCRVWPLCRFFCGHHLAQVGGQRCGWQLRIPASSNLRPMSATSPAPLSQAGHIRCCVGFRTTASSLLQLRTPGPCDERSYMRPSQDAGCQATLCFHEHAVQRHSCCSTRSPRALSSAPHLHQRQKMAV